MFFLRALLVLTLVCSIKCVPANKLLDGCNFNEEGDLKCQSSFSRNENYTYDKSIQILDISAVSMTNFPENQLHNLVINHLDASKNQLIEITEKMFAGATINTLSLSSNKIVSIEENSFVNLGLNSLWLEKNNLSRMGTEGLSKVLYPLKNVRTLNLNENSLGVIPDISHLVSLSDLQLINNRIVNLMQTNPDKLLLPDNLVTLLLGSNSIQAIDTRAFKNLKKLKHLNLQNNQISIINADTFKDLPELKTLVLSKNYLKQISAGIVYFNFKLNRLDLSSQIFSIETIDNYAFERTKPKNSDFIIAPIKFLDLSDNRIEQLPNRMFCSRDQENPYSEVENVYLGENLIEHMNPCIMLQMARGHNTGLPSVSFAYSKSFKSQKAKIKCDCNVTDSAKLVEMIGVCVKDRTDYSLKSFQCENGHQKKKVIETCDRLPQYSCERNEDESFPSSAQVNQGGNHVFTEPIENFNGKTVEPHLINEQNTHTSSKNQNLNSNNNKDRSNKVTNKPSQIAGNSGQNLTFSVISVISLIFTSVTYVRF